MSIDPDQSVPMKKVTERSERDKREAAKKRREEFERERSLRETR